MDAVDVQGWLRVAAILSGGFFFLAKLKTEVAVLRTTLASVETSVRRLVTEIDDIREERRKMFVDMARLEGRVENIELRLVRETG